jgi:hypothetical protein
MKYRLNLQSFFLLSIPILLLLHSNSYSISDSAYTNWKGIWRITSQPDSVIIFMQTIKGPGPIIHQYIQTPYSLNLPKGFGTDESDKKYVNLIKFTILKPGYQTQFHEFASDTMPQNLHFTLEPLSMQNIGKGTMPIKITSPYPRFLVLNNDTLIQNCKTPCTLYVNPGRISLLQFFQSYNIMNYSTIVTEPSLVSVNSSFHRGLSGLSIAGGSCFVVGSAWSAGLGAAPPGSISLGAFILPISLVIGGIVMFTSAASASGKETISVTKWNESPVQASPKTRLSPESISAKNQSYGQCTKDIDCPGDQICVEGKCQKLQKQNSPCKKDIDCQGDSICYQGHCIDNKHHY